MNDRSIILLVALAAIGLIVALAGVAHAGVEHARTCDRFDVAFHAGRARALLDRGYAERRWQDPTPLKPHERRAIRRHKFCMRRPADRARVADYRERAREHFEAVRFERLITPFDGPNGTHWAIPSVVVWCETRFTNASPHGYYALVSWHDYGGGAFAPYASAASFVEQSIVARRMYVDRGLQPWYPSRSCWA